MADQQSFWSEEQWFSDDWLKTRCLIVDALDERAGVPFRERKWRLFVVACLRRVWHHFKDKRTRILVDAVEQRADGLIAQEQFHEMWMEAGEPPNEDGGDPDEGPPEQRASACSVAALVEAMDASIQSIQAATAAVWTQEAADDPEAEKQAQFELLREIFGNPFRPIIVDPSWLRWNDGIVGKLAQSIYDDRAFDRMPILANALEEAGCANVDILAHCRQPGEHVRGCWVVDLILGKV